MGKLSVGDVVEVTEDFIDETTNFNYRGCVGCVRLIFEPDEEISEPYLMIEWNASTLRQLPDDFYIAVFDLEENWSYLTIPLSVVRISSQSFNENETEWEKNKIGERLFWSAFGRTGKLIKSVFTGKTPDQSISPYSVWNEYLYSALQFPFPAEVQYEYEEDDGTLRLSDQVEVNAISGWDYPLGVFCEVTFNNQKYILPLQDIAVNKKTVSKNARILEAYELWMMCRA